MKNARARCEARSLFAVKRTLLILGMLTFFGTGMAHAAQEVFAGEITSASPSTFTAGQSTTVTVRIRSTSGSGNVIIEADSWPSGWSVSPKNRNPTINQGAYYDQTFSVTPPSGGGSGTIVWKLYDDDWGTHPSGSRLLATRNQSVSATVPDTTPPSIPSLSAPSNGSSTTDRTPYFDWSNSTDSGSGVSHYEIGIYDKDITWGDISDTASSSNYTPSQNIEYDRIYWKVRAVDNAGNKSSYSTEWWFDLEEPDPPSTPVLETPANGSSTTDQTPYFNWASSSSSVGISHYEIEIYDKDITWGDISDTASSSNYTPSQDIPYDRIYWKVRAVDDDGRVSSWSSEWWFDLVEPDPPSKPVLQSPSNGSSTTDQTPSFDWSDSSHSGSGISHYEIEIYDKDITWGDISDTASSSNYTPSQNIPYDRIYWKVRAVDGGGRKSSWSTEWWFDLVPPTVSITDARVTNLVDNDGDGFASALTIEWDTEISDGSMLVYADLHADDWASWERDLGNSDDFTISTDTVTQSFVVPVESADLSHTTWDFQIDILKAGTTERVARLAMGADPELNDVKVELPSEDPTPPAITQHPVSRTVYPGDSASFSVTATGTTPLNYQWKHNGSSVGTNSSTLTIPVVHVSHAGEYWCIVSNDADSATSNHATLTVSAPAKPSTPTPANGTTVNSVPNRLDWVDTSGAVSYDLHLNGTRVGANLPISQWTVSEALASGVSHHWQVMAKNAAGSTAGDPWSFMVAAPPVLSYFEFSSISSPQQAQQSFNITIYARDNNGDVVPNFWERVYLGAGSSAGTVSRSYVTLQNGVWSGDISLSQPGKDVYLRAQFETYYGESNRFDVSGATGSITGDVTGPLGVELLGTSVRLLSEDGTLIKDGAVNYDGSTGRYSYWLTGIEQDEYYVQAIRGEYESEKRLVFVAPGTVYNLHLRSKKPPVLLVPGMMGSTLIGEEPIPALGPTRPAIPGSIQIARGRTHVFQDHVKWLNLELALQDGYEVFEVPWDWRVSVLEPDAGANGQYAWQLYLKPIVDEAKRVTGHSKVDVVAHSMGGLLTRSYIQSSQYDGDIDKLAMLGTPNEGAVTTYYPWEGGSPIMADLGGLGYTEYTDAQIRSALLDLLSGRPLGALQDVLWDVLYMKATATYTNVTLATYERMTRKNMNLTGDETKYYLPADGAKALPQLIWKTGRYLEIDGAELRNFYRREAPALGELMPTFSYVQTEGATPGEYTYPEDVNQNPLYKLNNGTPGIFLAPAEQLTKQDTETEKVRTRVFMSKTQATIRGLLVSPNEHSVTYPLGLPISSVEDTEGVGDGTVLDLSARGTQSNLEDIMDFDVAEDESVNHIGLIEHFAGQVRVFLDEGRAAKESTVVIAPAEKVENTPTLTLAVVGHINPFLLDPAGLGVGITPGTEELVVENGEAEVRVTGEGSTITIANPSNGSYGVELLGDAGQEVVVTLVYESQGNSSVHRFRWIVPETGIDFGFGLDSVNLEPIDLYPWCSPPLNVQAIDESGIARLAWDAPQKSAVVQYSVYTRREDETAFTLLGTTTESSLSTGHPWNGDGYGEVWYYVVLSVDAEGNESYFTYTAENGAPLVADFSSDVRTGSPGLQVAFTDESSGEIDSWAWDLDGDAVIDSTEQDPAWTYDERGEYTVSLTVSGPRGSDITSRTGYISIVAVDVPDVVGMQRTAAQTAITNAGLSVGTVTEVFNTAPVGEVLSQDPAAGASVPPGGPVSLTVSKGSELVTVPNVVGMQHTAAESALRDAGLTVGSVTQQFNAAPVGQVLSQNPSAGSSVAQDTSINLTVSKGPDETNSQPNTPLLSTPANGATGVNLTPTLSASSFSDPDSGDTHASSRWQADNNSDFSSPAWSYVDSDSNKTSETVPSGELSHSTRYYWRVQYKDNRGLWSDWSESWSFTTKSDDNGDNDGSWSGMKTLETKVAEEVLPLSIEGAPKSQLSPWDFLAIRLSSDLAIDAASVWSTAEADGIEIGVEALWRPVAPDDGTDGWVIVKATEPMVTVQSLLVTVGALNVDGEELDPVTEEFLVDVDKNSGDWAEEPYLIEDETVEPLPEILAGKASPVYRVGPMGVFEEPVVVLIPVPEGKAPDDLDIYYFSESERHRGWYLGENAIGWIVPDSRVVVEEGGQVYIQIEVNHSGVFQLGQAIEVQLGRVMSVDVGADGSRGQWLSVAATLLLLSAVFAGVRRRRQKQA